MRLLFDQGLPRSTGLHLRPAAIESIHVGEIGLANASDATILDYAREHGLIVVTLDADFHARLALRGLKNRPSSGFGSKACAQRVSQRC